MALSKKVGNLYFSTGRRKTSVARAVVAKGKGNIVINGKPLKDYFPAGLFDMIVKQPLVVTNTVDSYDIKVNVYGGGMSGQAGAIRHAIARALDLIDEKNHTPMKKLKLLTRDPRMVERKKYGQKKARKRFQFSKR
ncbi:MAG: 30S ribosomal protein S9 [Spirochaetes bacterium GWF1_31_7]|nr:MAG: 30S ribosomal protein S9 [Spirochaetes bacterium GWE1_32_154]OHD52592.1 MAG: 30S ribosomal protein S9 [Spirochaetes bacterium GWE2_31_10]OHD52960.1 MAG: 30S ribosomal protein S9 [Spirochaetes bacterium GWF1_31_7]OHD80236.1 MAG: 30S ribosomal protein S9 [Spirochaetes bacterium RIFOXYB1_FULL_32_8]HBD93704.1 30S ribosomal protein S9 [Spirochaetia bacterium]